MLLNGVRKFEFMTDFMQLNVTYAKMFKDEDGKEIVNECIYGEPFQIIKKSKEYSLIKLSYDNYEGWIRNDFIMSLKKKIYLPYLRHIYL